MTGTAKQRNKKAQTAFLMRFGLVFFMRLIFDSITQFLKP